MKKKIVTDARGLALKNGDAVCWVYSKYRQGGSMLTGVVVDKTGRYVKVKMDNSNYTLDKRASSLYKLSKGVAIVNV